MPATASLEELKSVDAQIKDLQNRFPEASNAFVDLLKRNRKVGYKNICRLLMGETTPEKLKEE